MSVVTDPLSRPNRQPQAMEELLAEEEAEAARQKQKQEKKKAKKKKTKEETKVGAALDFISDMVSASPARASASVHDASFHQCPKPSSQRSRAPRTPPTVTPAGRERRE